MPKEIYLIKSRSDCGGYEYYSEHGDYHGVSDAIGYDAAAHAKKFRTEQEAQSFLDAEMPAWSRSCHKVVPFTDYFYLTVEGLQIASFLIQDLSISDEMLEPTKGRLLIWRR